MFIPKKIKINAYYSWDKKIDPSFGLNNKKIHHWIINYNIFENHISIMFGYDELLLDSHSKLVKFYSDNNWRASRVGHQNFCATMKPKASPTTLDADNSPSEKALHFTYKFIYSIIIGLNNSTIIGLDIVTV